MVFGLVFLIATCIFLVPNVGAVDAENTWTDLSSMPGPRGGLGTVSLNDKIYAIGGCCQLGDTAFPVRNNEVYNPANDNWTKLQSMPSVRYWFGTAAYNNQIYCIGGFQAANLTGANEVYDTATNNWTTKTPLPTPRYQLCAYAIGDKIYALGGINASGTVGLNEVYNVASDSWGAGASIPTPVANFSSAVLDNKIYIIGGETDSGDVNLTQIYNPATDKWSIGAALPVAESKISAVSTSGYYATKGIYVFGIQGSWFYVPAIDNWIPVANMPYAVDGSGVAVLNDLVYVIGGFESANYPASHNFNERYTPFSYGDVAPVAVICSPENNAQYNTSSVALKFTLTKAANVLKYSLDGKEKVQITANITLTGLSNAAHTVTVYAYDKQGNMGTSETVSFTVNSTSPSPSMWVLILTGIIVAVVVVSCLGLLMFFRKRNPKKSAWILEEPKNVNYYSVNY